VPAAELGIAAEGRLLADILLVRVVGRSGLALQHIAAGSIDIGEIGAERAAKAVVQPIGSSDDEGGAERGGDQQGERHQPHPLAGEPGSAAQRFGQGRHGGGLAAHV
jgi:hypothetical protein